MKKLALILAVFLVLAGCTQTKASDPVSEIIENVTLPEGFSFGDIGDLSCAIVYQETAAGGILQTGIQAKSINEIDEEKYFPYLDSLAPIPMMLEYLAMHGGTSVAITVRITDPETEEAKNQMHYLFLVDESCYDLWLDTDLLDDSQRDAVRKSVIS